MGGGKKKKNKGKKNNQDSAPPPATCSVTVSYNNKKSKLDRDKPVENETNDGSDSTVPKQMLSQDADVEHTSTSPSEQERKARSLSEILQRGKKKKNEDKKNNQDNAPTSVACSVTVTVKLEMNKPVENETNDGSDSTVPKQMVSQDVDVEHISTSLSEQQLTDSQSNMEQNGSWYENKPSFEKEFESVNEVVSKNNKKDNLKQDTTCQEDIERNKSRSRSKEHAVPSAWGGTSKDWKPQHKGESSSLPNKNQRSSNPENKSRSNADSHKGQEELGRRNNYENKRRNEEPKGHSDAGSWQNVSNKNPNGRNRGYNQESRRQSEADFHTGQGGQRRTKQCENRSDYEDPKDRFEVGSWGSDSIKNPNEGNRRYNQEASYKGQGGQGRRNQHENRSRYDEPKTHSEAGSNRWRRDRSYDEERKKHNVADQRRPDREYQSDKNQKIKYRENDRNASSPWAEPNSVSYKTEREFNDSDNQRSKREKPSRWGDFSPNRNSKKSLEEEELDNFYDNYLTSRINYVKVKEIDGDLFSMSEEYSLAHCVAEDMNMGSGIAVQFSRQFKRRDELYSQRQHQGGLAILEVGGRYIYYMVTKKLSTGKPTYGTVWSSLKKLQRHIQEKHVKKLAIPRIACGLDRLEWSKVKPMIECIFQNTDVEITVCNFQQQGEDSSQQKPPLSKGCFVKNVAKPLVQIESKTAIVYFGSEDGYVSEEINSLNKKFRTVVRDYGNTSKKVGNVIQTWDGDYYALYGCIVKKQNEDDFDFISFQKCVNELKSLNSGRNKFFYVAIQAFIDKVDNILLNKIINILRHTLRDVDIYVCWPKEIADFMPRPTDFY